MEVLNSQGNLLTLQLADASGGISVQEVDGLDPVKATLISTDFANVKGADYEGATIPPRNITMKLGLESVPGTATIRNLRELIFGTFQNAASVTMTFFDDEVDNAFQIKGIVEDCTCPRFVQKTVANISVMCYDPDFIDPVPVTITGMTTADLTARSIDYAGTSSTGIVVTVNVNRTMTGFSLYYVDPTSTTYTMDFETSLLAGDVVTISTVPGDKYATLLRSGTTSSVLFGVSPQSTWPQISPGSNSLQISATGAAVPATIEYITRYGAF